MWKKLKYSKWDADAADSVDSVDAEETGLNTNYWENAPLIFNQLMGKYREHATQTLYFYFLHF